MKVVLSVPFLPPPAVLVTIVMCASVLSCSPSEPAQVSGATAEGKPGRAEVSPPDRQVGSTGEMRMEALRLGTPAPAVGKLDIDPPHALRSSADAATASAAHRFAELHDALAGTDRRLQEDRGRITAGWQRYENTIRPLVGQVPTSAATVPGAAAALSAAQSELQQMATAVAGLATAEREMADFGRRAVALETEARALPPSSDRDRLIASISKTRLSLDRVYSEVHAEANDQAEYLAQEESRLFLATKSDVNVASLFVPSTAATRQPSDIGGR